MFGYFNIGDGSFVSMGTNSLGNYKVSVSDGTTVLLKNTGTIDTGKYHIGVLRKEFKSIYLNYYDSSSSVVGENTNSAFITATSFEHQKFRIGCNQTSNGLVPRASINSEYLDGNVQEVIIYDRKLNDTETANVVKYLNNKYKIY